jgi:dihydroorotate dehydrogenase (NAD+) catalytic subunit
MDLKVKIGKTMFSNPVWVASGTFGYAEEFEGLVDLKQVGAILTKTVTLCEREGNPPPRIVETPSGLLNSIGLENKGIDHFKDEIYPSLKKIGTSIVVSIAGCNKKEFTDCAEKLAGKDAPDAVEVNLSCPNVAHAGAKYSLMAQDARTTESIIKAVRKKTKGTLIAKLTPNVTDITEIARAAEAAGADAVSLVNTYMGMMVDVEKMQPVLGNVIGGLSGPAIKPMALKSVMDTYGSVKIPVIGIGGIMTGTDVAEFMLAGASAVQVGTANLADPDAYNRILKEFKEYLDKQGIAKAKSLTGKLRTG